jgi:asparagine synthase (glutamine-hydrolysing)
MCGICGIHEHARRAPADADALGPMLASIHHRGPDDEGRLHDGELAMGMRRLSIIDLGGGHQPMANEDGSIVVVFNGEIYNYRELTAGLRNRGHRIATASDTEVIVHLYEELGDDCVHELRGMFGFALWDARRRRLLLARDRLGIKPLYYHDDGSRLVFGSEIKAVLAAGVPARLDHAALGAYLSLRYAPSPWTLFDGVKSLEPGCRLVSGPEGTRVERYWDVPMGEPDGPRRSEDDYAAELEELLVETIGMHLVSDVPFGAFLSGGIDSSTIVAVMSHLLDAPVTTFSIGFAGSQDGQTSELPYARMIAGRVGARQREIELRADDLIERLDRTVWHLDQPLADAAVIPSLMLAELASREVKMVLTGEGGDELFAGYARYSYDRLAPAFAAVPNGVRSRAPALLDRVPGLRRPKLALAALCQPDEATRLASWFRMFSEDVKRDLVSEAAQAHPLAGATVMADHLARTPATDGLGRMLYVDTKLWLPDDLLARGDKTAMASSVEARVPLLDHKVVEFAARLPPGLKLRRLQRKYLLRRVAANWIPREILERPKAGFPLPIQSWLARDAAGWVREILSPTALAERGVFRPDYVQRLLSEHERGAQNHSVGIFGLLSFELWARRFLDGAGAA